MQNQNQYQDTKVKGVRASKTITPERNDKIEPNKLYHVPELFTLSRTLNNWEWKDNTTIYFCRVDRKTTLAPYELLIADYETFYLEDRQLYENMINCLFTADEAEITREYIRYAYGWELDIKQIPLPYNFQDTKIRETCFVPSALNAIYAFDIPTVVYELQDDPDYKLPFAVTAYYEIEETKPSESLELNAEGRGILFAKAILEYLQLGDSQETIKEFVNEYFYRTSHYLESKNKEGLQALRLCLDDTHYLNNAMGRLVITNY